eukprot:2404321-Rhodomonas_salina.2
MPPYRPTPVLRHVRYCHSAWSYPPVRCQVLVQRTIVPGYALAMQCPVLNERMVWYQSGLLS